MVRYGFGEKTGESKKGGLNQYEHGHVEVSGSALRHAVENFPDMPPREAIGLMLAGDATDESVSLDYEALSEAFQQVDGVGEATADELVEAVQQAVGEA